MNFMFLRCSEKNEGFQIKKDQIILLSITVVVVIALAVLFAFPTPRSYITGVPIHFRTLDKNSTRYDVIKLYGDPIGTTPSGELELYTAEFLNVKGHIAVDYFENTDHVFSVQFSIRSSDYDTVADYERAVKKTCRYFDSVLSRIPKEEGLLGGNTWHNEAAYTAYAFFDSNIFYDEQGAHFVEEEEKITVFQFNTYTEKMKQESEDTKQKLEDLFW